MVSYSRLISYRSIWLVRIRDPDRPPVPYEYRLRVPQPGRVHRVPADQAARGRGPALQALEFDEVSDISLIFLPKIQE